MRTEALLIIHVTNITDMITNRVAHHSAWVLCFCFHTLSLANNYINIVVKHSLDSSSCIQRPSVINTKNINRIRSQTRLFVSDAMPLSAMHL